MTSSGMNAVDLTAQHQVQWLL